MHAQKGHGCLKYYPYGAGPPSTALRILAVPAPPPFQTRAHVSLSGETTLTICTLPFKEMLIETNT